MHTVRLKLKTTSYDRQVIEKRFHALSRIHNVLIKHTKKLLRKIEHDEEYQACLSEYGKLLKKKELTDADKLRKKELSKAMSEIRYSIGLTEHGLQSYIKVCEKKYRKCLSSNQVQKEASRIWSGVQDVLFKKGKSLHFKKFSDFLTIGGKSNNNGVKFDKETLSIDWLGLHIPCKPLKDRWYQEETLNHKVSYCDIERKMFPDGWHYYVTVTLDGEPPIKRAAKPDQAGTTGIDPGTSTIAAVSDSRAVLEELAPKAKEYNKKIAKLQEKMDRSKRAMNPGKYNPDGTARKGDKSPWVFSNTYRKDYRKLRSLYRQKSAYIKQAHEGLCNRLLEGSVNFITEKMDYKALQKRSKKTERQGEGSVVKKKDGTEITVHKYKKKKRFGKSLADRAPALFLATLKRKAEAAGGCLAEVDTKSFRASQYDHAADAYIKLPLGQRWKVIDGNMVQRDLYSAFLIKNAKQNGKSADRRKCLAEFGKFLQLHDKCIQEMKNSNKTMKQCFGF